MAALTANRHVPSRIKALGDLASYKYPVANAVYIYIGALLGLTDDGYVAPVSTVNRYGFIGISEEEVDNSGGANGAKFVNARVPPFLTAGELDDLTMVDDDIGKSVWVATDNPADITFSPASTSTKIGIIDRIEGGVGTRFIVRADYAGRASGVLINATLDGDKTLVLQDAQGSGQLRVPHNTEEAFLTLDANGSARDITLPAAALGMANCRKIFIANSGGEDLVIKDAAAATKCTISTSQVGIVWSDGTNWYGGIMPQT